MSASRTTMVELIMPNDANPYGTVFGGRVMQLVDVAGSIAASRHSGQISVTAALEHLDFLQPVRIGEVISVEATVVNTGRTSLDVCVRVSAENPQTGQRQVTSTAFLTYVAIDQQGKPVPVPAVLAETEEERRLQGEAKARRASRKAR